MAQGGGQHCIVSFEEVRATVAGIDISAIAEMSVTATANSIPSITLLVDPVQQTGVLTDAVSPMRLATAKSVLELCRGLVKTDAATLSLSFRAVTSPAADSAGEAFSLSGWPLTDVALSPVHHGDICLVSLTFMHPVCKSDFGGAVPGLLSASFSYGDIDGGNPLEVFIAALRGFSDAKRIEPDKIGKYAFGSDPAVVRDGVLNQLDKAVGALETHVRWVGGGMLPGENVLSAWHDCLVKGIAAYASPGGGISVFRRFAGSVIPECSLALGGDYTAESLEVAEFAPWSTPSFSIPDSDIIALQFPAKDPAPLSGISITTMEAPATPVGGLHLDASLTGASPVDVFYVPDSELSAEYMYGPIQQCTEPGWLAGAYLFMLTQADRSITDAVKAKFGGFSSATSIARGGQAQLRGAPTNELQLAYSEALSACAQAYYETQLMKDLAFSVTARLMFRANGMVLCPGKVVSFTSDGAPVISGYIQRVTHTVSVSGKTATTNIVCSYPQYGAPPSGITSTANALYR